MVFYIHNFVFMFKKRDNKVIDASVSTKSVSGFDWNNLKYKFYKNKKEKKTCKLGNRLVEFVECIPKKKKNREIS